MPHPAVHLGFQRIAASGILKLQESDPHISESHELRGISGNTRHMVRLKLMLGEDPAARPGRAEAGVVDVRVGPPFWVTFTKNALIQPLSVKRERG